MDVEIKIYSPIWDGRKVGLARYKLVGNNARVLIEYRRKDGQLVFPYVYEIPCIRARTYPVQMIHGVECHIIPIADLTAVSPRADKVKSR